MKKNIHITSVGASIITNLSRNYPELKIPNVGEDSKFEKYLTKDFTQIRDLFFQDPYKYSAELNALKSFITENSVSIVHLIITKTMVSRLTSRLISEFLKSKNIVCTIQKISGYYENKDAKTAEKEFIKSLSKLRNNLIAYIRKQKEKGFTIFINATGGFKPDIVILVLIASITNSKVYYIHEFFSKIVFIPPLFITSLNDGMKKLFKEIPSVIVNVPACKKFINRNKKSFEEARSLDLLELKYNDRDEIKEIRLSGYGKFLAESI